MRPLRSLAVLVSVTIGGGLAVMAGGAASAASSPPPDAWVSEYGGAGNAAYNAGETHLTAQNASHLTQAWSDVGGTSRAPSIIDGVVYHAMTPGNANDPSVFIAASAVTGKTLWTLSLPGPAEYFWGQSAVGDVVYIPFDGLGTRAGGVTAIDVRTRKILWSRGQSAPGPDSGTSGPVIVDAGRVFMRTDTITAFDATTGAVLWRVTPSGALGLAAGGGYLYAGAYDGLRVYDEATGALAWTGPGNGAPTLASGIVAMPTASGAVAVSARGCGRATCPALWTMTTPDEPSDRSVSIGGMSAATLFVTYNVDGDHYNNYGKLLRLSTTTGAVQWSTRIPEFPSAPVRAGGSVFLIGNGTQLIGYGATGTPTKPLVTITEPADRQGGDQGIAVSDGTLAVESWPSHLTGYRVS